MLIRFFDLIVFLRTFFSYDVYLSVRADVPTSGNRQRFQRECCYMTKKKERDTNATNKKNHFATSLSSRLVSVPKQAASARTVTKEFALIVHQVSILLAID